MQLEIALIDETCNRNRLIVDFNPKATLKMQFKIKRITWPSNVLSRNNKFIDTNWWFSPIYQLITSQ